jgi:hypothetical protein
MKQGIRTALIGLALMALAAAVAVGASGAMSASDGASADGSVSDQYGAGVSAGVQASVGPVMVQAAVQASYTGKGWRGGTLKHCVRVRAKTRSHGKSKSRKPRRCVRHRMRLRLAHKVRRASATTRRAKLRSPLCTLPRGCAANAPIGVGGRSSEPIRLATAAAPFGRASAAATQGPIGLLTVAGAALFALALVATARRTLRRARASRD